MRLVQVSGSRWSDCHLIDPYYDCRGERLVSSWRDTVWLPVLELERYAGGIGASGHFIDCDWDIKAVIG